MNRAGRHPLRAFGLSLDRDEELLRWLVASALLGRAREPEQAGSALRALAEAGLLGPELAAASPLALAALLARERLRDPDTLAPLLIRLVRSVEEKWKGSLSRLAASCGGLDELGGRLAKLAPGFGRAAVLAFLRPLRERWPAARELPLDPAARAAAIHLGLIGEGDDEEGEPGALRAALGQYLHGGAEPVELADAEWALARLGRAACARAAPARCPLGADCPASLPLA